MSFDKYLTLDVIKEVQRATQAGIPTCIKALEYAHQREEGYALAVAYVRASMITVSNNTIGFDETVQRIYAGGH